MHRVRSMRNLYLLAASAILSGSIALSGVDGGEEGGDPGDPDPCAKCSQASHDAQAQCREDGGSWWDCLRASRDALTACREENDCSDG